MKKIKELYLAIKVFVAVGVMVAWLAFIVSFTDKKVFPQDKPPVNKKDTTMRIDTLNLQQQQLLIKKNMAKQKAKMDSLVKAKKKQ